ncbi:hypothetical protein [Streptomyces sp. NPDC003393]
MPRFPRGDRAGGVPVDAPGGPPVPAGRFLVLVGGHLVRVVAQQVKADGEGEQLADDLPGLGGGERGRR